MKKFVYSIGLGIIGGALGNYLDIPLGWLLGAMVANMVASMQGLSLEIPNWLRTIALAALGVMLGTAFSPELLERIHRWSLTITGMICYLAVAVPWAIYYGQKVIGFDRLTAVFSSIPGGLSFMVVLASSVGADPRSTALAHTARLATILIVLPIFINQLPDVGLGSAAMLTTSKVPINLEIMGIFFAVGIVGSIIARFIRIPSPYLLGPMVLMMVLELTGLTSLQPPVEFTTVTQVVIGASIGAAFSGTKPRELAKTLILSCGLTLSLLALAVVFAYGLNQWTGIGFAVLLLAFVPGGLAEMGILALIMNIDPVFVASHHGVRVLLISLIVPVLATRWLKPKLLKR
jgi:hypothetical protein